jgi:ATP phosphoribosyltransferase regulatory subunit
MIHRIPSGTRDVLPQEMAELRALGERIIGVFRGSGYEEVHTPALEYERTFQVGPSPRPAHRVFDERGEVLVLRSDMTVPIARLASTRFATSAPPLRFSYLASAYRAVRPGRGERRELIQAGVELLGSPSPEGTAEALTVLCRALEAAGLEHFRVGLGDVTLIPALLEALSIPADTAERVLERLAAGDFVGIASALSGEELPARDVALVLNVVRTRGGPEVLEGLLDPLRQAAIGLRAVHRLLEPSIADRVIFDFGLVRSIGYYTGAVFQVYDPAYGLPIGGGGRYDDLLARFGRPLPAVGFALDLERVHVALTGEERHRA